MRARRMYGVAKSIAFWRALTGFTEGVEVMVAIIEDCFSDQGVNGDDREGRAMQVREEAKRAERGIKGEGSEGDPESDGQQASESSSRL